MNFRIASTLLALALPLCAQEQNAAQTEAVFYKAYYLEKGQRDFAGAMALYEEFLNKAPEHALAKEAATLQFKLLDRTGKTKERDAFKAKYEKLLGNIADAPTRPAAGGAEGGAEGGERGNRPQRGQGGAGGGRRGGLFALMNPEAKLADMSKEELQQVKDGLGGEMTGRMVDMVRNSQGDEAADKLEAAIGNLKKALDADKMDDAQKAVDALRESMPRMGGRRRGGGEGGDAGGGAGGGQRRGGGGGGAGGGNGGGATGGGGTGGGNSGGGGGGGGGGGN